MTAKTHKTTKLEKTQNITRQVVKAQLQTEEQEVKWTEADE